MADLSGTRPQTRALSVGRLGFWRHYLTTMRPYLFCVSALAGLAGMSLAGATAPWRAAAAIAAFALSYGFGQALTDCFQRDTDRLSAGYRPLVRGTISAGSVMAVSLSGLAAAGAILTWLNPWNLAASAAAVGALLAYTPLKRRWWAGPAANACIVALLPVMGWLVGAGDRPLMPAPPVALLAVAAMSFAAYANFVLAGYLKDIDADRLAGYRTLPVVFGWGRTAAVSDLLAVAAVGAGAWGVWLLARGGTRWLLPAGVVLLLAGGLSAFAQVTLHRTRRQDRAYRPILGVARVFLLLHVAVVTLAGPPWSAPAIALYLSFELLAARRPERSQV